MGDTGKKRHIYDELGVRKYINAADSYTFIGGSRMPQEVIEAMRQAAEHFVEVDVLHDRIGERIAELTRNDAAMITNGAAAGIAISVAACIAGKDPELRLSFPNLDGLKNEVIIHTCQRNGFDRTVSQLGVNIVDIGDAHGTSERELEEAIGPKTACILYFDTIQFAQGALPLDSVIRIAQRRGVKVVVDAAAQLPPVDNLWRYTEQGADLVIFSGGKTLCGPQSSGFIVGKKELVQACRNNAGIASEAIGRPMKVGKEEMVGLYVAIERYLNLDHLHIRNRHEKVVEKVCHELSMLGYKASREYPGPKGQDYAYAMIDMRGANRRAVEIQKQLRAGQPAVLVGLGLSEPDHFFINPLHLRDEEVPVVLEKIRELGSVVYDECES